MGCDLSEVHALLLLWLFDHTAAPTKGDGGVRFRTALGPLLRIVEQAQEEAFSLLSVETIEGQHSWFAA